MKGVIYTRVSGDEQVKGTSLEFQEEACREYCNRNNIDVVALFREEGESAKDLNLNNRRAFLSALAYCRERKNGVEAFVVLRVDRFARNTEDHFAVRKLLLSCETKLISVTEPIGNNPSEKFIETVLAGAAEYDNAIRRQRAIDGMSAKINQGLFPWRPPVGYLTQHAKRRGEKKTVPDQPDPRTFPIVQRALKYYATGACNQAHLAQLLDTWGLRQVRNQRTHRQFVDRLLSKHLRFYAGLIHNPFTGEDVRGLHTPMISELEMQAIVLIRSGRRGSVRKEKHNPLFPLRRTVACATCLHFLTGSVSRGNGGRYGYYHCMYRRCPRYGKSIPKNEIESAFREFLKRITPKPVFLRQLKKTVIATWEEHGRTRRSQANRHRAELHALTQRRETLFEMREDGSYTKDEFLARKRTLDEEITEKRLLVDECARSQSDPETALKATCAFISDLGQQWFDLAGPIRLKFQKLLFPEGIPYDRETGFGTARLACIFSLYERWDGSDEHLVRLVDVHWNQIVNELRELNRLLGEVRVERCTGPTDCPFVQD